MSGHPKHRLAGQLEELPEALRELRTFPAGVAYLWEQWSIIEENLSRGLPLLASTRRLCFSLSGTKREEVLRSHPAATRWFLAHAGMMYGEEATLDNVLALLGTEPPEWMQEAEFVNRVQRLLSAVPAKAVARELITGYVAEAIQELEGQWDYVNEIADRDIGLDAIVACLDATPAGISLANAIDKSDKSCLAAIRRLQAGRKPPGRPGPKRGPKKAETAAEALRNLVEPGQAGPAAVADSVASDGCRVMGADAPGQVPAAVAAEVQATVAVEVPTDDPEIEAEPVVEKCADEPISEPTPAEPDVEKCAVEPISGPAPAEPDVEKCADEPISGPATKEPDFERFAPTQAGRPRFPTGSRPS